MSRIIPKRNQSRTLQIHFLFRNLNLVLFALSLLTACSPKLKVRHLRQLPKVISQPVYLTSPSKTYSAQGQTVTFPGKIENVEYSPLGTAMIVTYRETQSKQLALAYYNLETKQVQWAGGGNRNARMMGEDVVFLQNGDRSGLVNASDGSFIRKPRDGVIFMVDDTVAIQLSKDISRIDLRTGKKIWSRPGTRWDGWAWDKLDDDWMFLVANGLHAFQLETGLGWHSNATTTYTTKNRIGINVLIGLFNLATFFSGDYYPIGSAQPKFAHNAVARPLPIGDSLFFASHKKITCFEKTTGKVFWESEINEKLGAVELSYFPEGLLLLVAPGYQYVDYKREAANKPSLFLLSSKMGKRLAKKVLEEEQVFLDFTSNDQWLYFLSENKIYSFDKSLHALEVFKIPNKMGHPLRFLTPSFSEFDPADAKGGFPLTVRTSKGVLALHPATLEALYFKNLGAFPKEKKSKKERSLSWKEALQLGDEEKSKSWADPETQIFWLAGNKSLKAVDLQNGAEVIWKIPLFSANFRFAPNNDLLEIDRRTIRVLKIQKKNR